MNGVDSPPQVSATCQADLTQRQRSLLSRIQRRYRTVTEPRRIGPLTIEFTRIAEPNRVLDQVTDEAARKEKITGRVDQDIQQLPYWAELWDSAEGVAAALLRMQLQGASVLDLGCGMGLSGTVAAAMGARVLFADMQPAALLFARLNSLPFSHGHNSSIRTRQLNWQTDRLDEQFDLILGADILYERNQWEWLDPFWRAHLAKNGTILLGEPGRVTGDVFADWAMGKGWAVKQSEEPSSTLPRPIRVFHLAESAPQTPNAKHPTVVRSADPEKYG